MAPETQPDIIIPFIGPIIAATSVILASVGLVSRNQSARISGQDTRIKAVEEDLDTHKTHAFDTYMPRKEHDRGQEAIMREFSDLKKWLESLATKMDERRADD